MVKTAETTFLEKKKLKLIHALLKRVSVTGQLRVKQDLNVIGKLDYPSENILMALDSTFLTARTRACQKEPHTVQWIENYIKPSHVLYDVGANVGAYSLLTAAKTEKNCQVYAFEPSFSTFASLCKNIFLNHFQGQITPFQLGLSNQNGLLPLHYTNITSGRSLHVLGEPIQDADGERLETEMVQSVMAYRLDDFISLFSLRQPNHIKIDVDNAVYPVIQGMENTFKRPELLSVLVELYTQSENYENSLNLLQSAGLVLKQRFNHDESGSLADHLFVRE